MKTRIAALALIALAVCASAALAATNTLKGSLSRTTAASGSKVTIKVKTNSKGVATKVTSFKIANAPLECLNTETNQLKVKGRVSASLGSFKVTKSKTSAGTTYRFSGDKSIKGVKHHVSGETSRKGTKAKGQILADGGTKKCRITDAEYSAKK